MDVEETSENEGTGMSYIIREDIEKFIEDGLNNPNKEKAFGHDAIEIMTEVHFMPAANVTEVVFCKDCIYRNDTPCPAYDTPFHRTSLRIKFCSCGKRKEPINDF